MGGDHDCPWTFTRRGSYMVSVSKTIITKSDQLNAEDLIAGDRVIKITGVTASTGEHNLKVNFEGDNKKPWYPCFTMQRALIEALGDESDNWTGKSLQIYNDKSVVYAGVAVGGIRISHIEGLTEPLKLMLTATRGKKKAHTFLPLEINVEYNQEAQDAVLDNLQEMDKTFEAFQKVIKTVIGREEPDESKLTLGECDAILKYLGNKK